MSGQALTLQRPGTERSASEEILKPEFWDEPLGQFARSTGVVLTLYSATGELVSGPHTPNPLSQTFARAGAWEDDGAARKFELGLVHQVCASNKGVSGVFHSLLPLRAMPVHVSTSIAGVFVVGWMFDHFADPLESERLAKELDLAPLEIWQLIRQHNPVPEQKLSSYCELLTTISTALVTEFLDRQSERRTSKILRILNQSAQALTSANTVRDIAVAAEDAALQLGAGRIRFYFADENGLDLSKPFETSGSRRYKPDADPKSGISQSIPVRSLDGQDLALIEAEFLKSQEFSPDELRSEFAALSSQIAVAIQKVKLISDLRSKKSALETTLDELRRASTTRDEFLATVSHELRSPLNAMLGWCQILRMGEIGDSKREIALETIERNAHAQAKLIEDLLDVSRIISGKMRIELTAVDLPSVIYEAVRTVRPATELKKIKIEVLGITGSDPVKGDFLRLQQVFWNLLSNAVRHTPSGGVIVVETKHTNGYVEVSISDSGEGIAEEFLPRLFDRFSQEDSTSTRSHGGLGLGLAIVKQIVNLHGGSISAHSRGHGLGSRFTVCLPQSAAELETSRTSEVETQPAPKAPAAPERYSLKNRKVLIVDDLSDSRQLMDIFVRAQGATTRLADSASAGLEALRTYQPDVIVSDIAMPGEDGFSFIQKVRAMADANVSSIPAIAVTAYSRDEDKQKCFESGFQDHVSKPVDPKRLVATIESLCAGPA